MDVHFRLREHGAQELQGGEVALDVLHAGWPGSHGDGHGGLELFEVGQTVQLLREGSLDDEEELAEVAVEVGLCVV